MPVILKSDIAEAWEIAANIAFLLGMRVGMLRRRCGTMMGGGWRVRIVRDDSYM
jgi:hypothetical protein